MDKLLHFLAGTVLALAMGYLMPPLYGLLAAILAGAGKELYDYLNPTRHTADWWDFWATAAGGFIAFLFISII